jgi:hypothetical protein
MRHGFSIVVCCLSASCDLDQEVGSTEVNATSCALWDYDPSADGVGAPKVKLVAGDPTRCGEHARDMVKCGPHMALLFEQPPAVSDPVQCRWAITWGFRHAKGNYLSQLRSQVSVSTGFLAPPHTTEAGSASARVRAWIDKAPFVDKLIAHTNQEDEYFEVIDRAYPLGQKQAQCGGGSAGWQGTLTVDAAMKATGAEGKISITAIDFLAETAPCK